MRELFSLVFFLLIMFILLIFAAAYGDEPRGSTNAPIIVRGSVTFRVSRPEVAEDMIKRIRCANGSTPVIERRATRMRLREFKVHCY